ncbi:hypothetical protein H8959_007049 [Pygathrix nigripes]
MPASQPCPQGPSHKIWEPRAAEVCWSAPLKWARPSLSHEEQRPLAPLREVLLVRDDSWGPPRLPSWNRRLHHHTPPSRTGSQDRQAGQARSRTDTCARLLLAQKPVLYRNTSSSCGLGHQVEHGEHSGLWEELTG